MATVASPAATIETGFWLGSRKNPPPMTAAPITVEMTILDSPDLFFGFSSLGGSTYISDMRLETGLSLASSCSDGGGSSGSPAGSGCAYKTGSNMPWTGSTTSSGGA